MRRSRTARRCTCTSALLLALLAGCGAKPRPFAYTDITRKVGALEFTHITVFRATSRAKLREVLARNNPGRRIRLPPIDFARQEAYLVATGPRSATGYALRIVRVEESSDHITVFVHERTPSLGQRVQARVTYPFRLIVLNSRKRVQLKWPGRP